MMETTQTKKRPTGMTILLVMSFINACWNILSSMVMFMATPKLAEMAQNGEVENLMAPFTATMSEEMRESMLAGMNMIAQIDTKYWLFLGILFIGSLMGVIRMFKGDKRGLHIYAISQILILINASFYLYPHQPQSSFVSDLLLTAIFVLLYYLYFKRMEMQNNEPQTPELP